MPINKSTAEKIIKKLFNKDIYQESLQQIPDSQTWIAITKSDKGNKKLVCLSEDQSRLFTVLQAETEQQDAQVAAKLCALSDFNAQSIRINVPWAMPTAMGTEGTSIGCGDRLGLATPGQIMAAKKRKVKPVLAQLAAKEVALGSRSYRSVLDNATWGVIRMGYQDGWGANACELSDENEIAGVLALGYTTITLDASGKLATNIHELSDAEVSERYARLPEDFRSKLESSYLNVTFDIQEFGVARLPLCGSGGSFRYKAGMFKISFKPEQLRRLVLIYSEVIVFTAYIYKKYFATMPWPVDFELSLNNAAVETTPQAALLIANEMQRQGVKLTMFNPRYVGGFPYGIDYEGDKWAFEQTFSIQAALADKYGYKLSFTGSDKYSLYPFMGRDSRGRIHIKTEGTSWLEALHTIWKADVELFRELVETARDKFPTAIKNYPAKADLTKVPNAKKATVKELESMLVQNDHCRQMLQITYLEILGDDKLRAAIYECLINNEDLHYKAVYDNLRKHIEYIRTIKRSLGLPKNIFFRTE